MKNEDVLRAALLGWWDAHARELPWRSGPEGGRDPYRVWVSEVLLQQTQVSRGLVYFGRFLEAFPDVHALARAPEEAVMKAWEGCGYYARARNLHRAARQVSRDGFPVDYAGWRALPGIGPYTAAAISSLALNEPRAVMDGNVRRVMARLFGVEAPSDVWAQEQADALLSRERPGAFNEAVMDLGATVCTPKAPRCSACPLQAHCAAFRSGAPTRYPAPKVRAQVREVHQVALLIGDREQAYLERRAGSLLGGTSGLPAQQVPADLPEETAESLALAALCARLNAGQTRRLGTVNHTMTHRRIRLDVYAAEAAGLPLTVVQGAALSRLDQKALDLLEAAQPALFG